MSWNTKELDWKLRMNWDSNWDKYRNCDLGGNWVDACTCKNLWLDLWWCIWKNLRGTGKGCLQLAIGTFPISFFFFLDIYRIPSMFLPMLTSQFIQLRSHSSHSSLQVSSCLQDLYRFFLNSLIVSQGYQILVPISSQYSISSFRVVSSKIKDPLINSFQSSSSSFAAKSQVYYQIFVISSWPLERIRFCQIIQIQRGKLSSKEILHCFPYP